MSDVVLAAKISTYIVYIARRYHHGRYFLLALQLVKHGPSMVATAFCNRRRHSQIPCKLIDLGCVNSSVGLALKQGAVVLPGEEEAKYGGGEDHDEALAFAGFSD